MCAPNNGKKDSTYSSSDKYNKGTTMKILSLELSGYTRMRLNGNKYIKITMTEVIQLILGTNGCGKSSLLAELSPQPANKEFFEKDGFKIIEIEHKGNIYRLSSHFSPKSHHSFMVNGERELNDGGTATAQKELVKQVFNHTQEIHDLFLGIDRFSSMGGAQRQKWLTMLCPTNYDYAIQTFVKFKERGRDTTGALKRAKERLLTEITKAISKEDEERLSQEVNQIHRELNELQAHRAPVTNPSSFYESRQNALQGELRELSLRLLDTRMTAPNEDVRNPLRERDEWGQLIAPVFDSVAQIDSAIERLKHAVTGKEALLNKEVREHTRLTEALKTLRKTGEQGIAELVGRLKQASDRRQTILGERRLSIMGLNANAAMAAFVSVEPFLQNLFSTIPENADRKYSASNYESTKQAIYKLKDNRTNQLTQLQNLNAKKAHMEQHKNSGTTTCPKCAHSWFAGFSESEYATLLEKADEQHQHIIHTDETVAKLEVEAEENLQYGNEYRSFVRCTQGCPELNPFWDYLFAEGFVTNSPRQALGILNTFRHDLELEMQAAKIATEMAQIDDLIRMVEQTGDMNFSETSDQLGVCTSSIDILTHELTLLRAALTEHARYRKQAIEMNDLAERIKNAMRNLSTTNAEMVEMMRRETIQQCIRQYQSSLAQKEEILSYVTLQKSLVEDLKEQVTILTKEEAACKELVKHLSPSEGLIAKGLLGFVRVFVGQMNGLIKKIWTYPLQVMDCGVTGTHGTELDYKFPMIVQNAGKPVTDISKGSTGMQEIVNLAFKVTAMNYLGMSDFPLILDEPGPSFDEAHRVSFMHAVKSLMEQRPFPQLFMISHYAQSYGSLTQAEVCVICTNNITIPKTLKYNQHVVLN